MYIREIFNNAFINTKSLLIYICSIVIILRIFYLKKGNRKFVLFKDLISLLFIIYIILLYYILINNKHAGVYLLPLKETMKLSNKYLKRFILKNIVIFIPFGYFISYYLNNKKVLSNIIYSVIITTLLEGIYYYLYSKFSIDIILFNVIGYFIGYLIYIALTAVKEKLPRFMKSDTFCNVLVIVLIAITLYFILK